MESVRVRLTGPQRGIVSRDEQNLFEAQRRPRGIGRVEMAEMNGIERAAEYTEPHAAVRTAAIWRHAASSSPSTPSPVAPEIR